MGVSTGGKGGNGGNTEYGHAGDGGPGGTGGTVTLNNNVIINTTGSDPSTGNYSFGLYAASVGGGAGNGGTYNGAISGSGGNGAAGGSGGTVVLTNNGGGTVSTTGAGYGMFGLSIGGYGGSNGGGYSLWPWVVPGATVAQAVSSKSNQPAHYRRLRTVRPG